MDIDVKPEKTSVKKILDGKSKTDKSKTDKPKPKSSEPRKTKPKPKSKKTGTSYINPDEFAQKLVDIEESFKKCEGGSCMAGVNQMMGEIQKANDRLDRDFAKGKIDEKMWKSVKKDTRNVNKNIQDLLDKSSGYLTDCILGKSEE